MLTLPQLLGHTKCYILYNSSQIRQWPKSVWTPMSGPIVLNLTID